MGCYFLTDICKIAKEDESGAFIYKKGKGWLPDDILFEYLYLGNLEYELINEAEAEKIIAKIERGERLYDICEGVKNSPQSTWRANG